MTEMSCQKFMDLWDNFRDGALSENEHLVVSRHLEACSSCRELYAAHLQVEMLVCSMEMNPLLRRRIAVQAASFKRPEKQARRGSARVAVPAAAFAVVVLLLYGMYLAFHLKGAHHQVEPGPGPLALESPEIRHEPPVEMSTVSPIRLADGRMVMELFAGAALWLEEGSQLEILEMSPDTWHFSLKQGRVLAEVQANEPSFRFVVSTSHASIEARGTVFSVSVDPVGDTTLTRVQEGLVEAIHMGESTLIEAGKQLRIKDGIKQSSAVDAFESAEDECLISGCASNPTYSRVAAVLSPSKREEAMMALEEDRLSEASRLIEEIPGRGNEMVGLLSELARAYRRAKMFTEAERVYLRLIRSFPKSEAASDSLVAIGQMEHHAMNRPKEALAHFDRYIAANPKGVLLETARAERVRALCSMGEPGRVVEAVTEYEAQHQNGLSLAEMLRRRVDAYVKLNRCADASKEYRRIGSAWPGSKESKRAEAALSPCM